MTEAPPEPSGDRLADATRFRHALVARPDLLERLGRIALPDDVFAAATAIAADLGIALDRDALSTVARAEPIDVSTVLPLHGMRGDWPPPGWLPARSVQTGAPAPAFDWLWFGSARLTDPFHADAVRRVGFGPMGPVTRMRTDLAGLIAGAVRDAAGPPDGLIFHMSRCGSTLAAQMLAAVPGHVVVSEAEPLDAVARWATTSGAAHEDQVTALRAVVAALGRTRSRGGGGAGAGAGAGASSRYFLKLDCWHGLALPLFRAAFPDTPWLFLHRDPVDVLRSLRTQPGIQSVPGALPAALIGFDPAGAASREDYVAHLFANLFDRILATMMADTGSAESVGRGMLVHYPDLVGAMARAIPAHFGFVPTPQEAAAMAVASDRDAKAPDQAFRADHAARHGDADPAITVAIARWLAPRYAALQRLGEVLFK